MTQTSAATHCGSTEACNHWQDFDKPVTIKASQAGDIYRAVHSIKATLKMLADHHVRLNSSGDLPPRFSSVELESMLAGALALANMADEAFDDLHFQDHT